MTPWPLGAGKLCSGRPPRPWDVRQTASYRTRVVLARTTRRGAARGAAGKLARLTLPRGGVYVERPRGERTATSTHSTDIDPPVVLAKMLRHLGLEFPAPSRRGCLPRACLAPRAPIMTAVNTPAPPENSTAGASPEDARRLKLERIAELGHDPWGSRFDDRELIGDLRARADEVKLQTAEGATVDMPAELGEEGFNFRQWLADAGGGEIVGPAVRAAGRIMLLRDKGKLLFIDIQDWSGRIQLFIGRNQVGEENWELAQCFDLGDLIGVDGTLRRTKTGELSIFAEKLHLPHQVAQAAAREAPRPGRCRATAAAALPGSHLRRRSARAFQEPHQNRAIDSPHARCPGLLRNRRPHAAHHCRRRGGPPVHHAPQHARNAAYDADRP